MAIPTRLHTHLPHTVQCQTPLMRSPSPPETSIRCHPAAVVLTTRRSRKRSSPPRPADRNRTYRTSISSGVSLHLHRHVKLSLMSHTVFAYVCLSAFLLLVFHRPSVSKHTACCDYLAAKCEAATHFIASEHLSGTRWALPHCTRSHLLVPEHHISENSLGLFTAIGGPTSHWWVFKTDTPKCRSHSSQTCLHELS